MIPSRNRLIFLSVATVVLVAALYAAGWTVLAHRWRAGIANWTESLAAKGWIVSTGAIEISGFPGTIRLGVAEPKAKDAAGNEWVGPPLAILVSPIRPLDPGIDAPGTHHVTPAGRAPVEITATTLTGRLTVAHGKPVALTASAGMVAGAGLTLQGLTVDLNRPTAVPDAPVPTQLAAIIGIDRLTLPEDVRLPLDRTIAAAHLALRVRGPSIPGLDSFALEAWREDGGTIEIDSLDVNWPPMVVAGEATAALDKNLQPELAGTARLRGGAETVDRAAAAGMIDANSANMAKLVLRFASKPARDGGLEAKAAIGIQNRILSIGPVQLMQLPEVKW